MHSQLQPASSQGLLVTRFSVILDMVVLSQNKLIRQETVFSLNCFVCDTELIRCAVAALVVKKQCDIPSYLIKLASISDCGK